MSQDKGPTDHGQDQPQDFSGYKPPMCNFIMVSRDLYQDYTLSKDEYYTLLALTPLIVDYQRDKNKGDYESFVPLTWSVIAEAMRLSESQAKISVARLEALERILVREGPPVTRTNGRTLDGPNLFSIRYSNMPPTDHLRAASERGERAKQSKQAVRRSEGVRPHAPLKYRDEPSRRAPSEYEKTASRHAPTKSPELSENTADPELLKTYKQICPFRTPPEDESSAEQTEPTDGMFEIPEPGILDRFRTVLQAIPCRTGTPLSPGQIAKIFTFPLWSPSDSWWIVQGILSQPNLARAQGAVHTALVRDTTRTQGNYWLGPISDQVAGVDWLAIPTDETPREDPVRRAARSRLGPLQRLPLAEIGVRERQAIREASRVVPASAPATHQSVADLLASENGRGLCISLLEDVRHWQETTRAFMKDWDNGDLSKVSQAAQDSLKRRLKEIGPIRLLSSARVDSESLNLWAVLAKEIRGHLDLDQAEPNCPF